MSKNFTTLSLHQNTFSGINLKQVFISFCLLMVFHINGYAQNRAEADTLISQAEAVSIDTAKYKEHSPHRATIYSMILPGLGQAYNKKYWKIPIIYAGFGVFAYFITFNSKEYNAWNEAYIFALENPDGGVPPINDYYKRYGYDPNILKSQKDYYRRNRDLTYILASLWYLLNVADAAVDAHLMTWNVDDDLSIRVEPEIYQPVYGFKPGGGLKLSLRF